MRSDDRSRDGTSSGAWKILGPFDTADDEQISLVLDTAKDQITEQRRAGEKLPEAEHIDRPSARSVGIRTRLVD